MSDLSTVIGVETDMNEFKKLQQRLNHEAIRHQFKKKVVGGLDEEDVTKYIEDLEGKLKRIEQQYKDATDETYSVKVILNKELEEKDKLLTNIDELKSELNDYIEKCIQKEILINSLNEGNKSENDLLMNEIQQISNERNELKRMLEEANSEIKQLKECAVKFENENTLLRNEAESALAELSDITAENNMLKTKLANAEKDNEQIEQLRNELNKSQEELKSLNELLIESDKEMKEMKEFIAEFENEENTLKARISELTEENKQIESLQKLNSQMTEEIKTFEELLSHAEVEIEQLRESFENTKLENTNMEAKIVELENTISAKDYKINEINRVCQDLKQQLEIEKSCSDKLNMDLVIFKQKIISLEETITEKLVELEEQKKIAEKAQQELSVEKVRVLNYRVNGFKDEISEVLNVLENLQKEASENLNTSAFLHQQLTIQQNRADKAESDLQAFMQILAGAKDKFYSERNPFGDQIKQLVEIEPNKEPVVNESYFEME